MAAASSNMKGFYRQKKSTTKTGIAKKSSFKKKPSAESVLVSHDSPILNDDYDKNEQKLRQFDMNMAYGPCIGMTRLARWERARCLGLNPPDEIESMLKEGQVEQECIWGSRV